MQKSRLATVVVFLWVAAGAPAGSIRISFLADAALRRETVQILRDHGVQADAVTGFQKAVERYHETPFALDTSKFPRPRGGFYTFETPARLVAALPHPLCDTKHPYEFNCFDTILLLAGDGLQSSLRPDDVLGSFLVPHTETNGTFRFLPVTTAQQAFAATYAPWYRAAGESIMPQRMIEPRTRLTAALFRCHALPAPMTEHRLGEGVMEALRADWKLQGLGFPPKCEVVLVHEVDFPQRRIVTAHGGVLFAREGSWVYLEKDGGSGPFVRLDFDDKADLRVWLSAMFKGGNKFGYTHHFMTFSDTRIEPLDGTP